MPPHCLVWGSPWNTSRSFRPEACRNTQLMLTWFWKNFPLPHRELYLDNNLLECEGATELFKLIAAFSENPAFPKPRLAKLCMQNNAIDENGKLGSLGPEVCMQLVKRYVLIIVQTKWNAKYLTILLTAKSSYQTAWPQMLKSKICLDS